MVVLNNIVGDDSHRIAAMAAQEIGSEERRVELLIGLEGAQAQLCS